MKITLKSYNFDTREEKVEGETSTYTLVRSMNPTEVAAFLEDFVNAGGKDYPAGAAIGKILQNSHRTLQASVVRFCLGIIVAISQQEHTDARNEKAVSLGKKVGEMLKNGELEMGYMI